MTMVSHKTTIFALVAFMAVSMVYVPAKADGFIPDSIPGSSMANFIIKFGTPCAVLAGLIAEHPNKDILRLVDHNAQSSLLIKLSSKVLFASAACASYCAYYVGKPVVTVLGLAAVKKALLG